MASESMIIKPSQASVAGVRITHPDRVLYAEQGITKQRLADYYATIADRILPYVAGRPLTMLRCPRGRASKCFFQKHRTSSMPRELRGVDIQERQKRDQYVVVDDRAGLVSLVQIGVLELHPWPARSDANDRPDQIVFDLDPGPGAPWAAVVEAAHELREQIDTVQLRSFVRTTGGKGLHVVIPLNPPSMWNEVHQFARSVAQHLAEQEPRRYVATASRAKRHGRVYVDYLRNSRGATAIASYSTRARPGAPVATPLRWDELGKIESADQYNLANLNRRLGALKHDPWQEFFQLRQSL